MLKRKIFLLVICFVALCLSAAPASADLFDFSVSQLNTVFDGLSAFSASKTSLSIGSVTGKAPPAVGNQAYFMWPFGDSGDFSLSMVISNIVSTSGSETADGTGSFIFADASSVADTITGTITGTWERDGSSNTFHGVLGNVLFTDYGTADGAFDGGATLAGSVPMGFSAPPWTGSVVQLTAAANWFGGGEFDVTGGSVDAIIVPVPAAVLLGVLGLGAVGLKLRKYA